jgi:tetratricopeptide (TPR) repeat protein
LNGFYKIKGVKKMNFILKHTLSIFLFTYAFSVSAWLDYDRAINHGQKGNWQQSKELLKNVVIEKPDQPEVLYDMGVSAFKSNEMDKALSYFTMAANTPTCSSKLKEQTYFNAGNAQAKLKQLPQALESYNKVLALNPDNKQAQHNKEIIKKMLEQEKKQQENKDQEDQNKQKDNQEKQKENDSKEQEKKSNQDTQQKDQQSNQNQNNKPQEKKDQQSSTKDDQQKSEQQKDQEASGNQAAGQENSENTAPQKQLPSTLAHALEDQEKKDAQLNKQLIKIMTGSNQGGASHGW